MIDRNQLALIYHQRVRGAHNNGDHEVPCDWCVLAADQHLEAAALAGVTLAANAAAPVDVADCECVPGHRCDCHDLRSLLWRILTSAEYGKMEAEGLAAAALGLKWSESQDRFVGPHALEGSATSDEAR